MDGGYRGRRSSGPGRTTRSGVEVGPHEGAISMPSCARRPDQSRAGGGRVTLDDTRGLVDIEGDAAAYEPSSTPRRGLDRAHTRSGQRPYEPRLVHQSEPTAHRTRRSAAQQPKITKKWQESGLTHRHGGAQYVEPTHDVRCSLMLDGPTPNLWMPRTMSRLEHI